MHLRIGGPAGRTWLAGAAIAAALGCNGYGGDTGGTDTDTGGTTGEALEFDDFFGAAEQSYCGWAVRCGAFADVDACLAAHFFDVIYPRSLLASAQLEAAEDGVAVEYLLAAYEVGRIEFDPAAAATCFAYVDARGCFQPHTYAASEDEIAGRAACSSILRGTMVQNGPCLLSLECAPQSDAEVVCGFAPTCQDACCIGGCRVLGTVPIGTPCTNQTRCEAGSFCANDPNTGQFTVCTKQKPIGASCQSSNECDESGSCDFNTGTCRAPVGAGQSCEGAGCQPGLFCADPGFDGNAICYAYEELGKSCPGEWFQDGCKEFGAACSPSSNTCVALPGPGQPCAQTNEGQCALSASCDWQTQTCVARAGEGEPCGDGIRCAGGLLCDGWDPAVSRCRAPVITDICPVPGEDELPEGT